MLQGFRMPSRVLKPSNAPRESPAVSGQRVRLHAAALPVVEFDESRNDSDLTIKRRPKSCSTAGWRGHGRLATPLLGQRYIAVVRFHSDVGSASKVQKALASLCLCVSVCV